MYFQVQRTIKRKLWMEFGMRGNYKWIDIIDNIVSKYNNTKHRTIGLKPNQVNKANEKKLLSTVFIVPKVALPSKFKVGDFVRIADYGNIFAKKYTPGWSVAIYKIIKVKLTKPPVYVLQNTADNEELIQTFYPEELQKTK